MFFLVHTIDVNAWGAVLPLHFKTSSFVFCPRKEYRFKKNDNFHFGVNYHQLCSWRSAVLQIAALTPVVGDHCFKAFCLVLILLYVGTCDFVIHLNIFKIL